MIFLALSATALLLQRQLNPHFLTEKMAAQIASDYAEVAMRKERPAFHSDKDLWEGEFRNGRWYMSCGSGRTTGWMVGVSFKADGTDKKISSSFSPE